MSAILLGLSLAPLGAGQADAWFWSDAEPQEEAAPSEPAPAPQTAPTAPPSDIDAGADLLQQGADLLLQGLRKEMAPAVEDLRDSLGSAMTELQPALKDLAAMLGDMQNYDGPEQLPNGDIIFRRKADAPAFEPPKGPTLAPDGAIDL